jgi:hypothetical protein
MSAVSSRDVKLNHLYARTMTSGTHEAHIELAEEINHRMKVDHIFEKFAGSLNDEQEFPLPRDFDCLRGLINHYEETCGKFSDYGLKYVKYLVKECENKSNDSAIERISDICMH